VIPAAGAQRDTMGAAALAAPMVIVVRVVYEAGGRLSVRALRPR